MKQKKKILAICGSTRKNSSNLNLIKEFASLGKSLFEVVVFEELDQLPHFNPDLDNENPPQKITSLRNLVLSADGVLICTPEYVFSIPGSLKNALEWFVSTTLFSGKPSALITASASGEMGHRELQLIMKTIQARFLPETCLLINGVKGRFHPDGRLADRETSEKLHLLVQSFNQLI